MTALSELMLDVRRLKVRALFRMSRSSPCYMRGYFMCHHRRFPMPSVQSGHWNQQGSLGASEDRQLVTEAMNCALLNPRSILKCHCKSLHLQLHCTAEQHS